MRLSHILASRLQRHPMNAFEAYCRSFTQVWRQLQVAKRSYDERVPEAVRDLLVIVLGLAVIGCTVFAALILLTKL